MGITEKGKVTRGTWVIGLVLMFLVACQGPPSKNVPELDCNQFKGYDFNLCVTRDAVLWNDPMRCERIFQKLQAEHDTQARGQTSDCTKSVQFISLLKESREIPTVLLDKLGVQAFGLYGAGLSTFGPYGDCISLSYAAPLVEGHMLAPSERRETFGSATINHCGTSSTAPNSCHFIGPYSDGTGIVCCQPQAENNFSGVCLNRIIVNEPRTGLAKELAEDYFNQIVIWQHVNLDKLLEKQQPAIKLPASISPPAG